MHFSRYFIIFFPFSFFGTIIALYKNKDKHKNKEGRFHIWQKF